jgi:PKD domain-containing protein
MLQRSTLRLMLVCAALATVGGAGAPAAFAADCNHTIFDGAGYRYDFTVRSLNPGGAPPALTDVYGAPLSGGSNGPAESPPGPVKTEGAWNGWGDVYVLPPDGDTASAPAEDMYDGPADACEFRLDGQEIAFPVLQVNGLAVQHRWYVDPGPLHGARILTILRNPATEPKRVALVQGDPTGHNDLGVLEAHGLATSDGSGHFSAKSIWGVSTDSLTVDHDPALAHVWDGPGGALRTSSVRLIGPTLKSLHWQWDVTLPAGQTAAFVSYEIQAAAPSRETTAEVAQGVEQAEARERQSPASLYTGMSAAEIAATMNWPHPNPTAAIAPVGSANAATPVLLDGGGSIAAGGLPQCTATYSWKVDDGAVGSSPQLSHFFSPGWHSATLTVGNDCGGTAQSAQASFLVASGLKLVQVRPNRGIGAAALKLRTLGPGKLTLSGRGVEKQAKRVRAAGVYSLIVRPTGRALRSLVHKGKATVKVTATLRPPGGQPSRLTKTIVLRRVR